MARESTTQIRLAMQHSTPALRHQIWLSGRAEVEAQMAEQWRHRMRVYSLERELIEKGLMPLRRIMRLGTRR